MKIWQEITLSPLLDNQPSENGSVLRIGIDNEKNLSDFLALSLKNTVPIVFYPSLLNEHLSFDSNVQEKIIRAHIQAVKQLNNSNYNNIILAADNDGFLQKLISPRFFKHIDYQQRIDFLKILFNKIKLITSELWLLLCIEELAPGGLDPLQGLEIALELEKCGLKTLVVAAGTRDFMPLFKRRPTQRKVEQEEFISHEASLASALWLRQKSSLLLWSMADFDDLAGAEKIAINLGLSGLIQKRVEV
jgi:hypothetical protein